jgi:hypothetical protein
MQRDECFPYASRARLARQEETPALDEEQTSGLAWPSLLQFAQSGSDLFLGSDCRVPSQAGA